MHTEITAAYARQLLDHDPETGTLRWRERPLSMFDDQRCCSVWNARYAGKVAGTINRRGYRIITIEEVHYAAHRLMWLLVFGEWPATGLDHVNGDFADNRITNLRLASQAENLQNQQVRSSNASGHIGVSWVKKRGKWEAKIVIEYKPKFLGYFDIFEDACAAYVAAKGEHHRFNPVLRDGALEVASDGR